MKDNEMSELIKRYCTNGCANCTAGGCPVTANRSSSKKVSISALNSSTEDKDDSFSQVEP